MNKPKKIRITPLITIASVLVIITTFSKAQFIPVWDLKYQHTSSNGFSNESRKIVSDNNGNIFILADATSDLDVNGIFTGSTYHYTIIMKLDDGGNILNELVMDVSNHQTSGFDNLGAFGLQLDAAGNVYVGYGFYGSGSYGVRFSKYNNSLVQQWTADFNKPGDELGVDMVYASNTGKLYGLIKGTAGSNTEYMIVEAGPSPVPFTANIRSFLVNTDVLNSLIYDGTANIYVAGYRLNGTNKIAYSAKVTTSGSFAWQHIFDNGSSSRDDIANSLTIGTDGFLYVTGVSDRGAPTNNDVFVNKQGTATGKIIWTKFFDVSNSNDAGRIIMVPNNTYGYIGATSSNSVFLERFDTSPGSQGGGITLGSNSNRIVYQPLPASYSTLGNTSVVDLKKTSNDKFYMCGHINATLSGNPFTASYMIRIKEAGGSRTSNNFVLEFAAPVSGDALNSYLISGLSLYQQSKNVFVVYSKASTPVTHDLEQVLIEGYQVPVAFRSENQIGNFKPLLNLYPVPAVDNLVISSNDEIIRLSITDFTGKCIFQSNNQAVSMEIPVHDWSSGFYFTEVILGTGEIVRQSFCKQ